MGWGRIAVIFQYPTTPPLPVRKSLRSQLSINIPTARLSLLRVKGSDAAGDWVEAAAVGGVAWLGISLRLFRSYSCGQA
jgi:hypothetical protein